MPGKSIRIYLADGTPLGIRHAELVNWTGQGIVAPRARLRELRGWEECRRPGVYFLFGEDPETDKALAYIGEAENVFDRLKSHAAKKEFWRHVALFTSKDDNLTKSHVKYLESRLVDIARTLKRWDLDNGNTPQPPSLPRADRDAMDDFIDPLRVLLGTLGFNILEPLPSPKPVEASETRSLSDPSNDANPLFTLQIKKHGVAATGSPTDEGFLVFAGSVGRAKSAPSQRSFTKRRRTELFAEGIFKVDGDNFVVVENVLFNSPSGAASTLSGTPLNGRFLWKGPDGRTFAEYEDDILEKSKSDDDA